MTDVREECQQEQQKRGAKFEITHFISKLYGKILALDINGLVRGCDLEVGNIIL